jgi:hypothetical protein
MNRPARLLLCAVLGSVASARAAELRPQDFAYGMTLDAAQPAIAYRLELPLDVYARAVRADLHDLRVFNARGEVVPHQLRRGASLLATRAPLRTLPVFALRGDPQRAIEAVRLEIASGAGAIRLQTQAPPSAQAPISSYIVDGRRFEDPASALVLQWNESTAQFAGQLRIEASEDLNSWREVATGSVANLRAGDEQLVENELEIPDARSRYWRLTWIERPAPFLISAVQVRPAEARIDVRRAVYLADGTAVPDKPGEYDFELPAHLPVDRVNLVLPERNTVARIELLARSASADPWRAVASTTVFRLALDDGVGETRNSARPIPLTAQRHWRLQVAQPASALGGSAPRLEAGWVPHQLLFLARGDGPFQLAYGSAQAAPAEVELESILPGLGREIAIVEARPTVPRILGGAARLTPPPKPIDWRNVVLWLVLIAGVALLGAMAYRLTRDMNTPAD